MTLDKRIAVGLIFALFVQAAGAFMWTGAAAQRLEMLEQEVAEQKGVSERLARVETELSAMRKQLDRIERKVEQP
jgi:sensor domain CHASE-containing protein